MSSAGNELMQALALLQLGDSLFPSGAFIHSYGLEQLAREGIVRNPEQLEAFVVSLLHQTLAPSDGLAAFQAARAALGNDLNALAGVDRALMRSKPASELRAASLAVGRRMLAEVLPHRSTPVLDLYQTEVHRDRGLGLHAVVFGAVCVVLGVKAELVPSALLFGSVTALLQVSMRLLPVSHRDVQSILHSIRPIVAELSASLVAENGQFRSFHPLQEIASMRHSRAMARLFAS